MKSRVILTAAAAATAVAAGVTLTPLVASAHPAAPAKHKHVYSFTSVTKGELDFSNTSGAQTETDANAKGKLIGYDLDTFSYNPKTDKVAITAVAETPSGTVYCAGTVPAGDPGKGIVTGGTGVFKGATGTFTSKYLDKAGTKSLVTITFYS